HYLLRNQQAAVTKKKWGVAPPERRNIEMPIVEGSTGQTPEVAPPEDGHSARYSLAVDCWPWTSGRASFNSAWANTISIQFSPRKWPSRFGKFWFTNSRALAREAWAASNWLDWRWAMARTINASVSRKGILPASESVLFIHSVALLNLPRRYSARPFTKQ